MCGTGMVYSRWWLGEVLGHGRGSCVVMGPSHVQDCKVWDCFWVGGMTKKLQDKLLVTCDGFYEALEKQLRMFYGPVLCLCLFGQTEHS